MASWLGFHAISTAPPVSPPSICHINLFSQNCSYMTPPFPFQHAVFRDSDQAGPCASKGTRSTDHSPPVSHTPPLHLTQKPLVPKLFLHDTSISISACRLPRLRSGRSLRLKGDPLHRTFLSGNLPSCLHENCMHILYIHLLPLSFSVLEILTT